MMATTEATNARASRAAASCGIESASAPLMPANIVQKNAMKTKAATSASISSEVPTARPNAAPSPSVMSDSSDGLATSRHAARQIMTAARSPAVICSAKLTFLSPPSATSGIPSPASKRMAI